MNVITVFFRKIRTLAREPKWLLIRPLIRISPLIDDHLYLKILFYLQAGYKLDLRNPQTYNQKLQWLKINYRKPVMTALADKYEAKKYIENKIGVEYVIKTLGVWDTFEQINFEELPEQFVLKTTHDSGGIVICKDKSKFDYNKAKLRLDKHLKSRNYYITREWPYKNIKPRILAEEYIIDESGVELKDYKFFCFNGEVKIMFIASERHSGGEVKFDFFDRNFNYLDIVQLHPQSKKQMKKPKNFEKMVELSEELSKEFPHIRIDFYNIDGKIYFGEFTFFHHGGLAPFRQKKWDDVLGSWIDLDNIC